MIKKIIRYGIWLLKKLVKSVTQRVENVLWKMFPQTLPSVIARVYSLQPTVWGGQKFSDMLAECMPHFLSECELEDKKVTTAITEDMLKCYRSYGINPEEYLIHHFRGKDEANRKTYLSKKAKDEAIITAAGKKTQQTFNELKDKYQFYQIAKKFFQRDACGVYTELDEVEFTEFCEKHTKFFAKPIKGRYGKGSRIIDLAREKMDISQVFKELLQEGTWIVEELIEQDARMAEWNPSSVNTIRIPSFRTKSGIHILAPFIRMGRKGSVVDNAGSGGIYATLDAETGKICSVAMDERGNVYEANPDNGKVFKGWQCPEWSELISISKEVHKSLPEYHKYVGFDFALSTKGWVLVEGNWGDFICQQSSLGRGMKEEFISLLNS